MFSKHSLEIFFSLKRKDVSILHTHTFFPRKLAGENMFSTRKNITNDLKA